MNKMTKETLRDIFKEGAWTKNHAYEMHMYSTENELVVEAFQIGGLLDNINVFVFDLDKVTASLDRENEKMTIELGEAKLQCNGTDNYVEELDWKTLLEESTYTTEEKEKLKKYVLQAKESVKELKDSNPEDIKDNIFLTGNMYLQ